MINVNFRNCEKEKDISGLWQYDYGQILRIQGLDLPTAVEIHFSLQSRGGESIPRTGNTIDGVTTVAIPNVLLANEGCVIDYSIFAFIYITDENKGFTHRKITLRVRSRPKPGDYNPPDEEPDRIIARQLSCKVNMPKDEDGNILNGESGQVLKTNGDGTTEWIDPPSGGSINITDDGQGNVTISGGISITDDGEGNVTIGG